MNALKKALIAGGCAVLLALGTNTVMAQGNNGGGRGRGNYDPAQMKAARLDRTKTELEITDDTEWNAISPKVSKVFDAQGEVFANAMRGARGGGNRRGGGEDNAQRQPRNNGFGGEPSAAVTALEKAIEDKAPTAEIKTKLAAVQAENKDKVAKLLAAQEELRGVLTPRQEAIATLHGLLQ